MKSFQHFANIMQNHTVEQVTDLIYLGVAMDSKLDLRNEIKAGANKEKGVLAFISLNVWLRSSMSHILPKYFLLHLLDPLWNISQLYGVQTNNCIVII